MKFTFIKIFSIIALFIAPILEASINSNLSQHIIKATIDSSINTLHNTDEKEEKFNLNQSTKFTITTNIINNLKLEFSHNGINLSNYKKKNNILSKSGKISITKELFSKKNYITSTNIIIPIDFSSKEKKIKNIILNNAHSYTFNKNLKLTAFHKDFININLNKISKVKISIPIGVNYKIIDGLNLELNANLATLDFNKKQKFNSILSEIPANLNITYNINKSLKFKVNANMIINTQNKENNKPNFNIGILYKLNIF